MAATRSASHLGDIRIKPDNRRVAQTTVRACASPGCTGEGTHRVPRSRQDLSDHVWFCLEHARAHNESWDFFQGMTEQEIEAFRDDAITGHRPTWPLGKRSARARTGAFQSEDHFGVFENDAEPASPRPPKRHLTAVQLQALNIMGLEETAALHDIKTRYKELVKRFHPDANGGSRATEERLKQVIKAYAVLRAAWLA